jgi:WD40 repeat protein
MLADQLLVLRGHVEGVNGVNWSPDFTRLATASEDGTARIWNTDTGEEINQLVGHEGGVNQAIWSPEGNLVATAGDDGSLRIWEAASGENMTAIQVASPTGSTTPVDLIVWSLAWSPDGRYLATGSGDGYIRMWEIESEEKLLELKGHDDLVTYLAWSPEGDRLVSTGADGHARIWNTSADNMVLSLPYGFVTTGGWAPDGAQFAVGTAPSPDSLYKGMVAAWDMSSGSPIYETYVDRDGKWEWVTEYSPDGRFILARAMLQWPEMTDANKFFVLDSQTGEVLRHLETGKDTIVMLPGWSPDGHLAAAGDIEGTIYFWDVGSGEIVRTMNCLSWGHIVRWSPDGSKIAMLCIDFNEGKGQIRVLDSDTYESLTTIEGDIEFNVYQWFNWSPDSTRIVVAGGSDEVGTLTNPIYIFEADSGKELLKIVKHSGQVSAADWSPDGKRVVSSSTDGTTRIWDAETGAELLTLSTPGNWWITPDWSPDGDLLLVSISNNVSPGQSGVWRVWQSTRELIDYAKECCVFRELTAEEREIFGLPER